MVFSGKMVLLHKIFSARFTNAPFELTDGGFGLMEGFRGRG